MGRRSLASLFGGTGLNGKSSAKTISKLKNLLSLAVARLTILKNQHQARCSLAHGDLAQLLQLGHCYDDRTLLRAEIVVKEENMLDVFAMIKSYCHLITERSLLLQRQKECPHELKEAVSSLIYASSRSGEMPEIHHVCNLFSSMFGREFVHAATELRNSCGVNPKIVQKLSTRQPSLESRMRIIKEIAAEKGITLDLTNYNDSGFAKADVNSFKHKNQAQVGVDSGRDSPSARTVHSYKDVASAAQAACEKAEDAAAAARAALELSRPSQPSSDDHDNRSNDDQWKPDDGIKEDQNDEPEQFDEDPKLDPVQYYTSESEEEEEEKAVLYSDKHRQISDDDKFKKGPEKLRSGFNSDSTEAPLQEKKLTRFGSRSSKTSNGRNALFDNRSESETEKQWGLNSEETGKQSFKMERQFNAGSDETLSQKQAATFFNLPYEDKYPTRKFIRESFKSKWKPDSDTAGLSDAASDGNLRHSYYSETPSPGTQTVPNNHTKKSPTQQSKVTRRAVSVRTRR